MSIAAPVQNNVVDTTEAPGSLTGSSATLADLIRAMPDSLFTPNMPTSDIVAAAAKFYAYQQSDPDMPIPGSQLTPHNLADYAAIISSKNSNATFACNATNSAVADNITPRGSAFSNANSSNSFGGDRAGFSHNTPNNFANSSNAFGGDRPGFNHNTPNNFGYALPPSDVQATKINDLLSVPVTIVPANITLPNGIQTNDLSQLASFFARDTSSNIYDVTITDTSRANDPFDSLVESQVDSVDNNVPNPVPDIVNTSVTDDVDVPNNNEVDAFDTNLSADDNIDTPEETPNFDDAPNIYQSVSNSVSHTPDLTVPANITLPNGIQTNDLSQLADFLANASPDKSYDVTVTAKPNPYESGSTPRIYNYDFTQNGGPKQTVIDAGDIHATFTTTVGQDGKPHTEVDVTTPNSHFSSASTNVTQPTNIPGSLYTSVPGNQSSSSSISNSFNSFGGDRTGSSHNLPNNFANSSNSFGGDRPGFSHNMPSGSTPYTDDAPYNVNFTLPKSNDTIVAPTIALPDGSTTHDLNDLKAVLRSSLSTDTFTVTKTSVPPEEGFLYASSTRNNSNASPLNLPHVDQYLDNPPVQRTNFSLPNGLTPYTDDAPYNVNFTLPKSNDTIVAPTIALPDGSTTHDLNDLKAALRSSLPTDTFTITKTSVPSEEGFLYASSTLNDRSAASLLDNQVLETDLDD